MHIVHVSHVLRKSAKRASNALFSRINAFYDGKRTKMALFVYMLISLQFERGLGNKWAEMA